MEYEVFPGYSCLCGLVGFCFAKPKVSHVKSFLIYFPIYAPHFKTAFIIVSLRNIFLTVITLFLFSGSFFFSAISYSSIILSPHRNSLSETELLKNFWLLMVLHRCLHGEQLYESFRVVETFLGSTVQKITF